MVSAMMRIVLIASGDSAFSLSSTLCQVATAAWHVNAARRREFELRPHLLDSNN
jgi:hypothetical protein